MQWAVSQAVPFRRMHVRGNIVLHQNGGWASGGWMSDALIDGNVGSGPQQQWISRNTEWGSWTGSNWNMVFVGVVQSAGGRMARPALHQDRRRPRSFARSRSCKSMRPATTASAFRRCAPTARASPGAPARRPGKSIPHRRSSTSPGRTSTPPPPSTPSWPRARTCCSRPASTTSTDTIRVTRANTVVLGLGFATLRPTNGTAAMTTADVDGVIIAGLLFDAGAANLAGPARSRARTEARPATPSNPISLHDVFFRVGGAAVGRARRSICRSTATTPSSITPGSGAPTTAPESAGRATPARTAWSSMATTSPSTACSWSTTRSSRCCGTATAGASTSISPRSPTILPTRRATPARPASNGWASYKVADNVTSHEAWGLGIYSVFLQSGCRSDPRHRGSQEAQNVASMA